MSESDQIALKKQLIVFTVQQLPSQRQRKDMLFLGSNAKKKVKTVPSFPVLSHTPSRVGGQENACTREREMRLVQNSCLSQRISGTIPQSSFKIYLASIAINPRATISSQRKHICLHSRCVCVFGPGIPFPTHIWVDKYLE